MTQAVARCRIGHSLPDDLPTRPATQLPRDLRNVRIKRLNCLGGGCEFAGSQSCMPDRTNSQTSTITALWSTQVPAIRDHADGARSFSYLKALWARTLQTRFKLWRRTCPTACLHAFSRAWLSCCSSLLGQTRAPRVRFPPFPITHVKKATAPAGNASAAIARPAEVAARWKFHRTHIYLPAVRPGTAIVAFSAIAQRAYRCRFLRTLTQQSPATDEVGAAIGTIAPLAKPARRLKRLRTPTRSTPAMAPDGNVSVVTASPRARAHPSTFLPMRISCPGAMNGSANAVFAPPTTAALQSSCPRTRTSTNLAVNGGASAAFAKTRRVA